jgi:hypothetical protein
MKALAAIALIGLASASEDNELFKFNNTKLNFPHHNHNATVRPQPIHQSHSRNATVQPKPIRKVHPILFNRNNTAHIGKPQVEKKPVLKKFDDEELFFADNIPKNQLNKKDAGKKADKNKEWLAPVGHKVLNKLISSFDDDELFNADINDDELHGFFGKVGSFVGKNNNIIVPMATKLMGRFDDEELHTIAAANNDKKNVLASTFNKLLGKLDDDELHTLFLAAASQNKNVMTSTWNKLLGNLDDADFSDEELASFFGKVGSFVAKNKNVITPVATKLIGRLDSEDDFEFRSTTGQVASQSKNVVGSIFNKLLGNLDDEFDTEELAFLGSYNRILQKNGPAVAKIGVSFNAFLNDAIKTYNDARSQPRNYGNLVNDGIQLVKDIKQKKHDDDNEFFKLADGQNVYGNLNNQNVKDLIENGLPISTKPVSHPKKFLRH